MATKGNNLHRQFSSSDDDPILDYLDLYRDQLGPAASSSLIWPASTTSFGLAQGPATVAGDTTVYVSGGSQPQATGTVFGGPVHNTGNPVLDALVGNTKWNNSKPITYFFDDADSVSNWTSVEKAAFRSALQAWADVANINFTETSNINFANFVQIKDNLNETGLLAHSGFPSPSSMPITFVFNVHLPELDAAGQAWTPQNFGDGGIEHWVIMHEIGHALGLAHPHDTAVGSTILPGVDDSFYDYGDNDLDQTIFTIMSYNQGYKSLFGTTTDGPVGDGIFAYGQAATPMPLDVAAIQYIYGANPDHNSGNNTYVLPTSNSSGTDWVGIYDTGGIDQIINPGKAPSTISLVAATIDESDTGGSPPSWVSGVNGGYTIDQNSVIENATGGGADDTIIGNHVDNVLNGNAGNDRFSGLVGTTPYSAAQVTIRCMGILAHLALVEWDLDLV